MPLDSQFNLGKKTPIKYTKRKPKNVTKINAEINKTENRKMVDQIYLSKFWFFRKKCTKQTDH